MERDDLLVLQLGAEELLMRAGRVYFVAECYALEHKLAEALALAELGEYLCRAGQWTACVAVFAALLL